MGQLTLWNRTHLGARRLGLPHSSASDWQAAHVSAYYDITCIGDVAHLFLPNHHLGGGTGILPR